MTDTTVAASSDFVSDTLNDLDEYAAFYATVNGYSEPSRPSSADVVTLRDSVASRLVQPLSQLVYAADGSPELSEGRTFLVGISAGILSCRSTDRSAKETTLTDGLYGVVDHELAELSTSSRIVDMGVRIDPETGELEEDDVVGSGRTEVMSWSAASRARMTRTLASLDYSAAAWPAADGALAMVTLTLPGDWKVLTPDGRSFKRLIRKFEHRWRRAVGPWRLLWKLEFQRRGAPHFHALMRVPALVTADGGYGSSYGPNEVNEWAGITETFESWLSRTWALVCDASREIDTVGLWVRTSDGWDIDPDYMEGRNQPEDSEFARHWRGGTGVDFSGKDFSDPRRISMYFAGHSAKSRDGKEYQHVVPSKWRSPGSGPGRFWGFAGLVNATAELEVTQRDFDRLRREMRKLSRARSWMVAVKRAGGAVARGERGPFAVPDIRAPRPRRSSLGGSGGQNGGWVLLNDAMVVLDRLAGWLADTGDCRPSCSWCGLIEPTTPGPRG